MADQPVSANGGPHGNYTATIDACAGCHRTNTAGAAQLLITNLPALCFTCHGSAATGANTNITDGMYEATFPAGQACSTCHQTIHRPVP